MGEPAVGTRDPAIRTKTGQSSRFWPLFPFRIGEIPKVFLLVGNQSLFNTENRLIKYEAYTATDLRGHVAIEKPVAGYDKRKIADDIRALPTDLRHSTMFRGGSSFSG